MISIVTTYYNRKSEFYRTLKSIIKSTYSDFELIAVDDGSSEEHRIEEYLNEFPFLKIIRIEPDKKWYVNSCIPFNIGIRASVGNIILLQNPECLHVGDILKYVHDNISETNYITFSTYALDEMKSKEMVNYIDNNLEIFLKSQQQKAVSENFGSGWYNHSKYRPTYFHFCSAITRKNMILLNGFDERFANGIACEDVDLVERIDRLGLSKIISDEYSVIHQWHPPSYSANPEWQRLRMINDNLWKHTTNLESKYYADNDELIT